MKTTQRLPETALPTIQPVSNDKGLKASDVPLETLINVWNCSPDFQSVRGLMKAFGFTNHQAQKAYARIQDQIEQSENEEEVV